MIDELLSRLSHVKKTGNNRWMACCPAHDDKTPSLALQALPSGQILLRCFSGCEAIDVVQGVGLSLADLFPEGGLKHYRGWQQLEKTYNAKKEDSNKDSVLRSKLILEMCNAMRRDGQRLSPQELQREREAYMEVRRHEHRNG